MHVMPFGKFRGRPLAELPDDYLGWLAGLPTLRDPLKTAVEAERARRLDAERAHDEADDPAGPAALPPAVAAVAVRIVTRGYRSLAHEVHPDHGGQHVGMLQLTAARNALVRLIGRAA